MPVIYALFLSFLLSLFLSLSFFIYFSLSIDLLLSINWIGSKQMTVRLLFMWVSVSRVRFWRRQIEEYSHTHTPHLLIKMNKNMNGNRQNTKEISKKDTSYCCCNLLPVLSNWMPIKEMLGQGHLPAETENICLNLGRSNLNERNFFFFMFAWNVKD